MHPVEGSKVYRLFYPQVPAVVSCEDRGLVYAMPVVSTLSISNNPPLIGVASSPSHRTHQAISSAGCFSLCWLDSSQVRSLEFLGASPPTGQDKLHTAGLRHSRGKALSVPLIDGSVASLECSLYGRHMLGDHELLIGKVQAAHASDDFMDYWQFKAYNPVLYAGTVEGRFRLYRSSSSAVEGADVKRA